MALGDVMVASRFSQSSAAVSNYLEELPENRNHVDDDDDRSDDGRNSIYSNANVRDLPETVSTSYEMMTTTTSMAYLPKTVVLCEFRHDSFEECLLSGGCQSESCFVAKWKPQGRMRTACVGLALCLNISVPPPDVIKISPCASLECWVDPFSMPRQKALETIRINLNQQYERWQPKARYKLSLDPTVEEIKKLCTICRKTAKVDRVLFHYNGHGVPKPCPNGDIFVFNKNCTEYISLSISELDSWLGSPSVYVFDCSAAELIVNAFIKLQDKSTSTDEPSMRDCILLAACEAHETLPQSVEFPADVFTSCLTTPVKMALRWFHPHSLLHESFDYSMIDRIPGRQTDRQTLLGELNWIFTAVTDTIAWNVLPQDLFQRLYRQDLLVASLFRNFLLAEKIMRSANCSPVSYPRLPPTHQHHMWDAWDMAAELLVSQLPTLLANPDAEFQPSSFFAEQLTAFEVWLDHGSDHKKPPEQLPIVLQVLLCQTHRFRALILLGRFMDMGPWAVDLALSVGIFPYALKLLQTNTPELRQILVFIWTKILALHKTCQVDLVKDGGHIYFIKFLDSVEAYPEQRAMAAFVLAIIVEDHKRGQEVCSEAGLVHVCLHHVQCSSPSDAQPEPLFLQWICLCLGKLWEDYLDAQILGLQADAPGTLARLLSLPQPEVRAAAVFALSTLLDFWFDTSRDDIDGNDIDDDEKVRAESGIIRSLLEVASDGSPLVRTEVAVALSRFSFGHKKHLKSVAAAYCKPQFTSPHNSLPSFTIKGSIIVPSVSPLLRLGNDSQIMARDGRISTSSPLAVRGMRHGSPLSDDSSSLHSDCGGLTDSVGNGVVNQARLRKMDNSLYLQCVLAACTLAEDPSPRVASLGRRVLSIIGIEQVAAKSIKHVNNNLVGLARSLSWFELTGGGHLPLNLRTPPVSPPRASYLTGMRRVSSLEFKPHQMSSADSGLADPLLSSVGSSGASECSILPQSTIYSWSCGHFSKPLLTSMDDNEFIVAKREENEKMALDHVVKCQHSSVSNLDCQIASWDTKFETGTKAALMHPFSPVVIASDENEMIRVWNYEDATALNSFHSHNNPVKKGVSKVCLVNELDESLLLVASNDGHIRIWKDYTSKGQQKLVTAFASVQDQRTGVQCKDAVVDWQQQSGYLFASGDIPSIMAWDLDREQLVRSISFPSDSSISVLAASQVHGGQFAAGFVDGYVRLYDIRSPEMLVTEIWPNTREVERVVGIGFQPGLEPTKIVSGTPEKIQFMDMRSTAAAYLTIRAHRGSLTTLAVHRHAPVIATGSSKQIIKVFNLEGDQLGLVGYHPTFMGQRIGSVSCLHFHPYKLLLAAGASDSYVSLYADEDSSTR